MRSELSRVSILASVLLTSVLARQASAADTDWGGANLTITANTTMDGVQSNIGTLTIQSGVTVTVTPGLTLTFNAQNADIAGTINANGAGYAGGAAGLTQALIGGGGFVGQGPGGGLPGVNGMSGSGSGGGGGGGGSYGGLGGAGGGGYSTCNGDRPAGGNAGGVYGSPTDGTIQMGSGGGGSGGAYTNGSCTWAQNRLGAVGGRGGGAVIINAVNSLSLSGSIFANGANGSLGGTAGCGGAGSSGGGSGGGVLLSGGTVSFTGAITAAGGMGGGQVCAGVGCGSPTSTTCNAVSIGQSGGGGRVKIFSTNVVTVFTGSIDVSGRNPGTVLTPSIRGTVSPSTIAFGGQRVGTSSAAQTVTIQNTGTGPLVVSSFTITGANASDFAVTAPATPFTIPLAGSQTFTVTFTPATAGGKSATVNVGTNDTATATKTVTLTGTGTLPTIAVAPPAVTFANTRVGTTSAATTVTISNTGTATLKITNIALMGGDTGDFALASLPTLPAFVAPAGTATFDVTFAPTTTGARASSVAVMSDDPTNPTVAVPLAGNGISPMISFDPAALDFGNIQVTTTSSQMVTLHNTGTDSLTVSAIQVTGSSTFTLTSPPTLPQTIAAGGSLALTLAYAPTAISADTGTLTLVTDMPGNPNATVPLSGQGVSGILSATPLSIDFGSVVVSATSATTDVTITNTGNTSFDLTAVTVTGSSAAAFPLSSVPTLPATIAPSSSVTVKVAFAPTVAGAATGTLVLTSNIPGGGMTVNVDLSGQGIQAGIGSSPMSLDFGTVLVGATSAAQTITLRNTGDAPLMISAATLTGAEAAAYAIAFTPPSAPLAPGDTTTLTVTFAPTAVGLAGAMVHVTSSDSGVSALDIPVTGAGADTSLSVSPLSLDFGAVDAGDTSAAQTVTLTNTGPVAMSIAAITSSDGSFVVTAPTLPANLDPGASVSFDVVFTPPSDGAFTGTIQVDTANKPNAAMIAVAGTGTLVPAASASGCCDAGQGGIPPVALIGVVALGITLLPRRRRRR